MCLYPSTFLTTDAFLLSASALSLDCLERDFVNSISNISINVFTAIVRMKTEDLKRECFEHLFENWNQVLFAYFRHTCDHFKLSFFIHGIDMINALLLIQITLMHGINTNIARLPVRSGFTPLADG